MDDKETSCQGSNFGDFKSVNEVVRFYKLPLCLTKRQRRPRTMLTHSRSRFANVKILSRSHEKWASDLDSPLTFMPKYKILSLKQLCNCFYGHYVILGKKHWSFSYK